ncbi:MAG TPA: hypothetical protein VFL42_06840 [Terriglobales bacterium]|nr:hypothetical protein [Terriglobales bacterium]
MKKTMLTLVFAFAFVFTATTAWADRGHENDDKPRVNAEAMSLLGLAAASIVGTGVYLVRRQKYRR